MSEGKNIFSEDRSERLFRLLVKDYRNKVIRFISLYIQNDLDCEELASDVFLSLWMNWDKVMSVSNLDNYIFIIAKNKALNHLRHKEKTIVDIDSIPIDFFHNTYTTPESIYISEEMTHILNEAINTLPQKIKLAFLLVRESKKSYKEAADILGVSAKTIEKQVAAAVEKLKEKLLKSK
jgi:RNA polymerase sigma-70 factor (ECF subfamily)